MTSLSPEIFKQRTALHINRDAEVTTMPTSPSILARRGYSATAILPRQVQLGRWTLETQNRENISPHYLFERFEYVTDDVFND